MARLFVIFIVALALSNTSKADTPGEQLPFVVASEYGPFYVAMFTGGKDGAHGIAYELLNDGTSIKIWQTSYYSSEVFLSNNGKYLVAMGPWAFGNNPSKEDLAVSFFKNGKLLKRYSTLDLVKDATKVKPTESHYFWRSENRDYPKLTYRNIFHLKTIDEILYKFDAATGEIVEQKSPYFRKDK